MLQDDRAERAVQPAHPLEPVALGLGKVHLAHELADQGIHDVVLAGKVVIHGHPLDAQLVTEGTNTEPRQASLIHETE